MNIALLDHIIVTVSDLPRSIAFYSKALAPLGIIDVLDYKGHDGHPDLMGFGRGNNFLFWLKSGVPSPASVHFAFVAKSRAMVDAFYAAAIAAVERTTSRPASGTSTTPTITRPMCLTWTAIASRP